MAKVVTPYQKAIYDVLSTLIKQEKKDLPQEQRSLLATLKKYKTFDNLLDTDRFYYKRRFYVLLGIIATYTLNLRIAIYIVYASLITLSFIAHQFKKKQRALLHFCRQCNIEQATTNKPSIADPFVFEAVKQWIEQDFGLDSPCYAFLQQTSSIFELRVYYAMWTTKYKYAPSPKSRILTQELYPYLQKKGFKFAYLMPNKAPLKDESMKDKDAIQLRVFSELKEHITNDRLASNIKDDFAISIKTEYLALENLDELKGIMWAWRQYFKDEVAIVLQKSITSKCDLSWYLQEKVKLHTANLYLTKYQVSNK